ncbi:hypothetical protein Tco_1377280 [Tanacetum coccineum]
MSDSKYSRSPARQCPVHMRMESDLGSTIALTYIPGPPTSSTSPDYIPGPRGSRITSPLIHQDMFLSPNRSREPKEDDEDPEEDPADYPADRGI